MTPPTTEQPPRRRRTDRGEAPTDLQMVTATTKAALQLALERMDAVMDRAEQVLADEQEEQLGG